jgi:hypothetical protein
MSQKIFDHSSMVGSWPMIFTSRDWWYLDPKMGKTATEMLGSVINPIFCQPNKSGEMTVAELKTMLDGNIVVLETNKYNVVFDGKLPDIMVVGSRDVRSEMWSEYAKWGLYWLKDIDRGARRNFKRVVLNPTYGFMTKDYVTRLVEAATPEIIDLIQNGQ